MPRAAARRQVIGRPIKLPSDSFHFDERRSVLQNLSSAPRCCTSRCDLAPTASRLLFAATLISKLRFQQVQIRMIAGSVPTSQLALPGLNYSLRVADSLEEICMATSRPVRGLFMLFGRVRAPHKASFVPCFYVPVLWAFL